VEDCLVAQRPVRLVLQPLALQRLERLGPNLLEQVSLARLRLVQRSEPLERRLRLHSGHRRLLARQRRLLRFSGRLLLRLLLLCK
jgi:hypothetical protein